MNHRDYLARFQEPMPAWLANHKPTNHIKAKDFLNSRIVYYPGSGNDGHPVKLFGSSHVAHCFIYADYGVDPENLEAELGHPTRHFRGYHSMDRIYLMANDLTPDGWRPHVQESELPSNSRMFIGTSPFGFIEVLVRDPELDDSHGAERLAILFLGADGFAAYDAIFCQSNGIRSAFAVVVQDHGFGGNYERFDRGGLLEMIAKRSEAFPEYLLVAEGSKAWEGYEKIDGLDPEQGGMHRTSREIYMRQQPSAS